MKIIDEIKSLNYDEDLLYDYIIEQSKKLETLNKEEFIDNNKIFGCMSTVYIIVDKTNTGTIIKGFSDSKIISGILGILAELVKNDPSPVYESYTNDLSEIKLLLSQNRRLGFDNIIKKVFK